MEFFLEDAPSQITALREAVRTNGAHSVEQVAHTLKDNSGNMGALWMSRICVELQEVGASENLFRFGAARET